MAVTITERPTNTDPVANAGEDDSYDDTIDCTPISYGVSYDCDDCSDYDFQLDGTSSYDPDGDCYNGDSYDNYYDTYDSYDSYDCYSWSWP